MSGLTRTQRILLEGAAKNPLGLIQMCRPDRRGTRVTHVEDGPSLVVAYQSPEWHLKQRGLLEPVDGQPHVYRITDAGRVAVMAEAAR